MSKKRGGRREERRYYGRTEEEEVRNGGPRRPQAIAGEACRGEQRSTTGQCVVGNFTDVPEVFESHVVPKLNGNDVKFFYDVNTESRAYDKTRGREIARCIQD